MDIDTKDWGEISPAFDEIVLFCKDRDLTKANEAQTRFDVIDRMIKEVLGWSHGQIQVEERTVEKEGYIDYSLRGADDLVLIEAKKAGDAFPSPTRQRNLKLNGSVLGHGAIAKAIAQVRSYANEKRPTAICVTNGFCWCFLVTKELTDESYAHLFFPFHNVRDAEELYKILNSNGVASGTLRTLTNEGPPRPDNRLLQLVANDVRIDRNNIADYIQPALNEALYSESLLNNIDSLDKCFVTNEQRTRYDKTLEMYFADLKPKSLQESARRIKREKYGGQLGQVIALSSGRDYPPPVTILLGAVGVGKSTYLAHFSSISGRKTLEETKAHWIYVDFEKMGSLNPRAFIYQALQDFLNKTVEYDEVIRQAYHDQYVAFSRGPLKPLYVSNKDEFERRFAEIVFAEYEKIEPYVDKVMKYLGQKQTCVVVLDNADLTEDDYLETEVFTEGVAFSKRTFCHLVISIRDSTFIKHQHSPVFNAHQLRKFWIDPPPFKAVLSRRLTYAKKILEGRQATIEMPNGSKLVVKNLDGFFDLVQRSMLEGEAGDFIDSVSDLNIRRGLYLVTNFLTSGHIEANRAVKKYLVTGETSYTFPFHEIFKGTMLGQWKYYKEERADCVNLFDSRVAGKNLRLLRLYILALLAERARLGETVETPVPEIISMFTLIGASDAQIVGCLEYLRTVGLIRSTDARAVTQASAVTITRSGGYYRRYLVKRFIYVETCIYDTAIESSDVYKDLSELTTLIENETNRARRMLHRKNRIVCFLNYWANVETQSLDLVKGHDYLFSAKHVSASLMQDVDLAVRQAERYYGSRSR